MTTHARLRRLASYDGMNRRYARLRGELVAFDSASKLDLDMGPIAWDQAWWDVPLPPCPDCGGVLVWAEAGYVPGARQCQACGSLFTVDTVEPSDNKGSEISVEQSKTPITLTHAARVVLRSVTQLHEATSRLRNLLEGEADDRASGVDPVGTLEGLGALCKVATDLLAGAVQPGTQAAAVAAFMPEALALGKQGPGGLYKPDASPTRLRCARCGAAAMWIAGAGEALCVRHQDDY